MPAENPQPAHLLAHFHVPDIVAHRREYGRKVVQQLATYGAVLLVASPSPTVLEGDRKSGWTVVIQFPDHTTVLRRYKSEEYAPLKKLRLDELVTGGTIAIFNGYQPTAATA